MVQEFSFRLGARCVLPGREGAQYVLEGAGKAEVIRAFDGCELSAGDLSADGRWRPARSLLP